MSIKFLLLGGGVFWVFLGGGGECRFYFYGREDSSDTKSSVPTRASPFLKRAFSPI